MKVNKRRNLRIVKMLKQQCGFNFSSNCDISDEEWADVDRSLEETRQELRKALLEDIEITCVDNGDGTWTLTAEDKKWR